MTTKHPPRQVEVPMSEREKELESLLQQISNAARDILWCALVWNDHNFSYDDLRKQADAAAKALGFVDERGRWGRGSDAIDKANAWMDRVNKALGKPVNG